MGRYLEICFWSNGFHLYLSIRFFMNDLYCDVLIVGGSLGGVAGAIRAAAMGADVLIVEESGWIGGQMTSQGVCTPDENRWIEYGGGTAGYRELRRRIRYYYQDRHRLSNSGTRQEFLNPGSCWVSRISAEPKVARGILHEMLNEHRGIRLLLETSVLSVEQADDRIAAVVIQERDETLRIIPKYVLDATELGDLLPLGGVEHVLGAESREETGEPDAPESPRPDWIQPYTVPFALELRPRGEDHTISRPEAYEENKRLQNYHILDGAMKGMFGDLGWWTYRRVIAAENFADPAYPCDVAMINTGSNDFKGGVIPTGPPESDAETIRRARLASLGYVHWLQTECPRVDEPGRFGYPEFRLRADWFDTPDGLAPAPYIRESRRIRALKTVYQQDVVAADSSDREWQVGPRAAHFSDSCGIGHYWLDIHEGGTDEPNRFMETRPFQIPLGSLIPIRARNLLAACKNIGVTHLTNGAYRLHPIEWNIGESAGALAAFCSSRNMEPAEVWQSPSALSEFQDELIGQGIPLYWWGDLAPEHPAFKAAQRLAMEGLWPESDKIEFEPEGRLADTDREALESRLGGIRLPDGIQLSADAAQWVYRRRSMR